MRVFVYEYLCATTDAGGEPSPLWSEGWAMLRGLVEDFGCCAGVETVTLLHPSCPAAGAIVKRLAGPATEADRFREVAREADLTIAVAPECGRVLVERCRWAFEAGARWLGSTASAIELTADKLALGAFLRERGLPAPETTRFPPPELSPDRFPLVWKPRDGAGSQATYLVRDAAAWTRRTQRQRTWPGETVIQTFVPGRAASVLFLLGGAGRIALVPAAQDIILEDGIEYRGGTVPLPDSLAVRAQRLAEQAVDAVPGLAGFVGVDLVLGAAPDGTQDWIIEINPRLTTSYVGLRALARDNLAAILLELWAGRLPRPPRWRSGLAHFDKHGNVRLDAE